MLFPYDITRELEFVEVKDEPLRGMNSQNDIENAPGARKSDRIDSVNPSVPPSRGILSGTVPIKADIVKRYREKAMNTIELIHSIHFELSMLTFNKSCFVW